MAIYPSPLMPRTNKNSDRYNNLGSQVIPTHADAGMRSGVRPKQDRLRSTYRNSQKFFVDRNRSSQNGQTPPDLTDNLPGRTTNAG
jgi:hypothetical protein